MIFNELEASIQSNPTLSRIWIETFRNELAIRVDFTNDTHFRKVITGETPNEVSQALFELAFLLKESPLLQPCAYGCAY